MSPRRLASLLTLTVFALLGLTGGSSASAAAPIWNVNMHHNETNFTPGSNAEYWIELNNVGDANSSGPIKVRIELFGGLTRQKVESVGDIQGPVKGVTWSCPGGPGATTIVCSTTTAIPRHMLSRNLVLTVDVPLDAEGDAFASVEVEGGGAAASANAFELTHISPQEQPFGIVDQSWVGDFYDGDGLTPVREAGAHPDLARFNFDLNSVSDPQPVAAQTKSPAGSIRDVTVGLPPGFVGNTNAVEECTSAELTTLACPASSVVGRFDGIIYPPEASHYWTLSYPIFNMSHPRGVVSDLAFVPLGAPVHIKATLDPTNQYAIQTTTPNVNEALPAYTANVTIWGVPSDSSHDSERCTDQGPILDTSKECSTDAPQAPFLSAPSRCDTDHVMRLHHYDSWQEPGKFGPEVDYTMPGQSTNCDKPRFEPDVEIVTTGKQANTPTGLDVHVKIAQNENPNALATPPVKRFTVTLPEGMSFSPSFADGLQSCTLAQMQLGNNDPVQCPDASRIGEVSLHTPLLPKSAEGSMYLAAQGDNPFGSTFALILVIHDTEERGALIKIPGRIDVDEQTGRIVTTFEDTPQFPFDDLTLKFRNGPRAPLVSPPTCGKQTIGVEIASYAQPQKPIDASNTYQVTEGPNGTPCPPDSARRPFHPTFTGGTLNPVAGTYSPFLFRMTRSDDEQELSQVSTVLPPGLVAKIAGVSLCPDAAINSISTALGAGKGELNNPACPASSEIGSVSAGLGAGPGPNYFPGKVYLAGPYKGAQLSLAVVAPGLAGPYDLGNVVVRAALHVNPETAQVRAVSDPFPTNLHGVILRVRDIRLRVDRPQTTINPTNCSKMSVDGQITGVGGSVFTTADDSLFAASSPFQVGSCADLAFKPKLDFRLFGGTKRGAHPKFRATLRMPPGGANIKAASVALPHSEFLDQGHIKTICTRVQFAANNCPAGSIYGTVSAKTPLLDETLTGPIYLRSSNHQLPDLVATFRGGRIDANLVGRVDSINGGIRNSFDFVPDVPVTSATFDFFGGAKGLLVNSTNLCAAHARATAKFQAQNGDALTLHPKMGAKCAKAKKSKPKHAKR
jgi:hypothetical protein